MEVVSRFLQLFKGTSQTSFLLRSGFNSALINLSSRILSVVIGIALARGLGAEGYGVYAFAFAFMSLISIPALFGMHTFTLREVSASRARNNLELFHSLVQFSPRIIFVLAVSVSAVAALVIFASGKPTDAVLRSTLLIMLIFLPLAVRLTLLSHILRGMHHIALGQFTQLLLSQIIFVCLILGLFLLAPEFGSPQIAMSMQVITAICAVILTESFIRARVPVDTKPRTLASLDWGWLNGSFPFMLNGAALLIIQQTDTIMIGWFTSLEDVGVYRVAAQGAVLVIIGQQIIQPIVAPHFARLHAQNDTISMFQLYKTARKYCFLSALIGTTVLIAFGSQLLSFVFGAQFDAGYPVLVVLCFGYLANSAYAPIGTLLSMTGHERTMARILWFTAFLNIFLNTILIIALGMIGAAIATSICLAVYHILFSQVVKKNT